MYRRIRKHRPEYDLRDIVSEIRQRYLDCGCALHPVLPKTVRGPVCETWWGKMWCRNIKQYADFRNRLPRGKRYIRLGTVIDMRVTSDRMDARVVGGRSDPYEVRIDIDPLSEKRMKEIEHRCIVQIQDMYKLVNGVFPEGLRYQLVNDSGLFPAKGEIHCACSCPDSAIVCKHVAAVLYGFGIRFDTEPLLLYKLRNVDIESLIYRDTDRRVEQLLNRTDVPKERWIAEMDALRLFGL